MLKGAAHLQAPKAAHAGQPRALAPLPVRHNARWVTRAEGESGKVEKKGDDKGSKKVQKADRTGDTLFFADDSSLTYLDGTLPADYGFDPLGLSDPEGAGGFVNPEWLRYSEVIHARWAMLGAAGCIAPEILASAGVIPQTPADVTWFRTGVIPPAGQYGKYWTDPYTLFYLEVIAFQFAELRRWQDFRKPGCMSEQYFLGFESVLGNETGNPSYPGGSFFNFAGFGKKGESELKDLQTKEIKNGRLAMVAVFGYGAQAVITHQGPWANLQAHLADPTHNNILTNFGKLWQ